MFYFKIKSTKCNHVWQKSLGNAAYISNNLAWSERNHGCTSIYKLRSLDAGLNNNTTNQINGTGWLQFKGNNVEYELLTSSNFPVLSQGKSHSRRVTGECNSRALKSRFNYQEKYLHGCIMAMYTNKIGKVPRGIQGKKSSKDIANSINLVSTIGSQASPKKGDRIRCPED